MGVRLVRGAIILVILGAGFDWLCEILCGFWVWLCWGVVDLLPLEPDYILLVRFIAGFLLENIVVIIYKKLLF